MKMKKMYIGIYAAIALLIILGNFSWFVYGIIKDSDAGAEEARSVFSYFAKQIILSSEEENFAESTYNQKLYALAEELELKVFVVSNAANNPIISWPKDSELISHDERGNFIIKPASLFVKNFSGKINVKALKNYDTDLVLTASIPTLKPQMIYLRLRNAFFIMLALLLVTIIVILLTSLSESSEKVYADITDIKKQKKFNNLTNSFNENINEFNSCENEGIYTDVDESAYQESAQDFYNEISTNNSDKMNFSKPGDEYIYNLEDLDNLNITKHFPYEAGNEYKADEQKNISYVNADSEEYTNLKHNKITVDSKINADIEKVRGLYSPITGISWQEYLPEYLESELRRAASSEQDIALVIIKLKDFTLESLIAKKIAGLLIDFIKFRDMIFEFDNNGFAAILQDTNLDEAMKKSEEIYKGIKNILTEYDISEPISIGITTRTSRLISSDRMIEEATAAVNRAINNTEDPIVAFRVNPEKYREFISEN